MVYSPRNSLRVLYRSNHLRSLWVIVIDITRSRLIYFDKTLKGVYDHSFFLFFIKTWFIIFVHHLSSIYFYCEKEWFKNKLTIFFQQKASSKFEHHLYLYLNNFNYLFPSLSSTFSTNIHLEHQFFFFLFFFFKKSTISPQLLITTLLIIFILHHYHTRHILPVSP